MIILGRKPERMCRACGCTDSNACVTTEGPCCWVLMDVDTPTGICSACAIEFDFEQELFIFAGREDQFPDRREPMVA